MKNDALIVANGDALCHNIATKITKFMCLLPANFLKAKERTFESKA